MNKYENILHKIESDEIKLDRHNVSREIIKDALKKQIGLIPNKWNGKNINAYICPGCDFAVYEDDKFCKECGQALEWGIE